MFGVINFLESIILPNITILIIIIFVYAQFVNIYFGVRGPRESWVDQLKSKSKYLWILNLPIGIFFGITLEDALCNSSDCSMIVFLVNLFLWPSLILLVYIVSIIGIKKYIDRIKNQQKIE